MWKPIAAVLLLALFAVSLTQGTGWAQPPATNPTGPRVMITSLPVRPPLQGDKVRFADVSIHLVGQPNATSFGISARATITPEGDLTGKERPVVYLYATCDDEAPIRSGAGPVATVELGALEAGHAAQTVITTATGTALVPSANVACAKVGVVCHGCGAPPAPAAPKYVERLLPSAAQETEAPLKVDRAVLTALGDPGSKSFGLSFDGSVTPTRAMTGKEKLVVDLYAGCTGAAPGFFVGGRGWRFSGRSITAYGAEN
jgi:hypothetical protein